MTIATPTRPAGMTSRWYLLRVMSISIGIAQRRKISVNPEFRL
jgi:hypothetical protein